MKSEFHIPNKTVNSDSADEFFTTCFLEEDETKKFLKYQKLIQQKSQNLLKGSIISFNEFENCNYYFYEFLEDCFDYGVSSQDDTLAQDFQLAAIDSFETILDKIKTASSSELGNIMDRISDVEDRYPDKIPEIISVIFDSHLKCKNVVGIIKFLEYVLMRQNFDLNINRNPVRDVEPDNNLFSIFRKSKNDIVYCFTKNDKFIISSDTIFTQYLEHNICISSNLNTIQFRRDIDKVTSTRPLSDFVDPNFPIKAVLPSDTTFSIIQLTKPNELLLTIYRKQLFIPSPKSYTQTYTFKADIEKVTTIGKRFIIFTTNHLKYEIEPPKSGPVSKASCYYNGICSIHEDYAIIACSHEGKVFSETIDIIDSEYITNIIPKCYPNNCSHVISKLCEKIMHAENEVFDMLLNHRTIFGKYKWLTQNPEIIINYSADVFNFVIKSCYDEDLKNYCMTMLSRLIILNMSFMSAKNMKPTVLTMNKATECLMRLPNYIASIDSLTILVSNVALEIYNRNFVKNVLGRLIQFTDISYDHPIMAKNFGLVFITEKMFENFDIKKSRQEIIERFPVAIELIKNFKFDNELLPFFQLFFNILSNVFNEEREKFYEIISLMIHNINNISEAPIVSQFICEKMFVFLSPLIGISKSKSNLDSFNKYFLTNDVEIKSRSFHHEFVLAREPKFIVKLPVPVKGYKKESNHNSEVYINDEEIYRDGEFENELDFHGTRIHIPGISYVSFKGKQITETNIPKIDKYIYSILSIILTLSKCVSICLESLPISKEETENAPLLESLKISNRIQRLSSGPIGRSNRSIIGRTNTVTINSQEMKNFLQDIIKNTGAGKILIDNLKNSVKTIFKKVPPEIEEAERYAFSAVIWRANLVGQAMNKNLSNAIKSAWKSTLKVRTQLMRAKQMNDSASTNLHARFYDFLKEIKSKSEFLIGQEIDTKENPISRSISFIISDMMMSEVGKILERQKQRKDIHNNATMFFKKLIDSNFIPDIFKRFFIERIQIKSNNSCDSTISQFLAGKSDDFYNVLSFKFVPFENIIDNANIFENSQNQILKSISSMILFCPYYEENDIKDKLKIVGENSYKLTDNRHTVAEIVDVIRYQFASNGNKLLNFIKGDDDISLGTMIILGADIFNSSTCNSDKGNDEEKVDDCEDEYDKIFKKEKKKIVDSTFKINPPEVKLDEHFIEIIRNLHNNFNYKDIKSTLASAIFYSFLYKLSKDKENSAIITEALKETNLSDFAFQKIINNFNSMQVLRDSFFERLKLSKNPTERTDTFLALTSGIVTEDLIETDQYSKSFFVFNGKMSNDERYQIDFDILDHDNDCIWAGFIDEGGNIACYDLPNNIFVISNPKETRSNYSMNEKHFKFSFIKTGKTNLRLCFGSESVYFDTNIENFTKSFCFIMTLTNKCRIQFSTKSGEDIDNINEELNYFPKTDICKDKYCLNLPSLFVGKRCYVKDVGYGTILEVDGDDITVLIESHSVSSTVSTFNRDQCIEVDEKFSRSIKRAQEFYSIHSTKFINNDDKILRTLTKLSVITARFLISRLKFDLNGEQIIRLISTVCGFGNNENQIIKENYSHLGPVVFEYLKNVKINEFEIDKVDSRYSNYIKIEGDYALPFFIDDFNDLASFCALWKFTEFLDDFESMEVLSNVFDWDYGEVFLEFIKRVKNYKISNPTKYTEKLQNIVKSYDCSIEIGLLWLSIIYQQFVNNDYSCVKNDNCESLDEYACQASFLGNLMVCQIPPFILDQNEFNIQFKIKEPGTYDFPYQCYLEKGKKVLIDDNKIGTKAFTGIHKISFEGESANFVMKFENNFNKSEYIEFCHYNFEDIDAEIANLISKGIIPKKFNVPDWIIGARAYLIKNTHTLPLKLRFILHDDAFSVLKEELEHSKLNNKDQLELNFNRFKTPKFSGKWDQGTMFSQFVSQVKDVKTLCKVDRRLWLANLEREGAVDAGGPMRASISQIAEELMNQKLGVFTNTTNFASFNFMLPSITAKERDLFYAGAFICGCMVSRNQQNFNFPDEFWKFIVSGDFEQCEIRNQINCDDEKFFIKLAANMKFVRDGFVKVLNDNLLRQIPWNILKFLCCGHSITYEFLSKRIDGYNKNIFLEAIKTFSNVELCQLMEFITGSPTIPVDPDFRIRINHDYEGSYANKPEEQWSIPVAHTCFRSIDIPDYKNASILSDKLRLAMLECSTINDREDDFDPDFDQFES